MGRDNRARRAAKQRRQAQSRAGGRVGDPTSGRRKPPPSAPGAAGPLGGGARWQEAPLLDPVELALGLLNRTATGGRRVSRSPIVTGLLRLDESVVSDVAENFLLVSLDVAWKSGWQPAELLRHARRTLSAPAARMVGQLIANDHARRRAQTLDPRWIDQVDGLHLPATNGRGGWLARWRAVEGFDRVAATDALVAVSVELSSLRRLEVLIPPPGRQTPLARVASMGSAATSDPVLVKVRRLLAKAESSEFEAEASAFTAKAQELMARHAIDAAMVQASGETTEVPVVIRLPVDDPYVDAKSVLLHVVATEGRCRAVFMPDEALATIVGFATDVAAAEMLFTSLLIQAQTALAAAAEAAPPGSLFRSRGYRSSFLLSFAHRIGERLRAINDAVIAEADAEQGPSLMPALRARSDVIEEAMTERFGTLTTTSIRGASDAAGWAGGQVAADNARLAAADLGAAV